MDRTEFLNILEEALRGEIPAYEIAGHLQYYDSYIRENNGKTEEEKLQELGDPRLIAKTIIEARMPREGYVQPEQEEQPQQEEFHYKVYRWDTLAWYQKLLAVIMLILVIAAVIVIAGVGIRLFISVVLPVLLILLVIRLIFSIFS